MSCREHEPTGPYIPLTWSLHQSSCLSGLEGKIQEESAKVDLGSRGQAVSGLFCVLDDLLMAVSCGTCAGPTPGVLPGPPAVFCPRRASRVCPMAGWGWSASVPRSPSTGLPCQRGCPLTSLGHGSRRGRATPGAAAAAGAQRPCQQPSVVPLHRGGTRPARPALLLVGGRRGPWCL